ncbi:sensor histidine kinase [Nocardia arizonensis]|uniref:sensor histidine kinase n=1 Tax=Nocardia arizonensis TaxID=1141647 RepID=UPI0006D1097B|nr:ATP-binding protein [Nocardia arizonensis]
MALDPKPTRASVIRTSDSVATIFLHATCVLVGLVELLTGPRLSSAAAEAVICLILWSGMRLVGRRHGTGWSVADLVVVQCYLLATVTAASPITLSDSLAQRKIVAATLISLAFTQSAVISAAATVGTMLVLYWAGRDAPGGDPVGFFTDAAVAYLIVQWAHAALLRHMLMRAAGLHDRALIAANTARAEAETAAVQRRYEREQWALLHDTVASTLLMVGHGAVTDSDRVAEQARRDLDVLGAGVPIEDEAESRDLVATLETLAKQCRTPVVIEGLPSLPVRSEIAHCLSAATREALTNTDQHAEATEVRINVERRRLTVSDNGSGLAANTGQRHGVRRSILGRLRDIGGDAVLLSEPGRGTRVTMTWPDAPPPPQRPTDDVPVAAQGVRRLADHIVYVLVAYIGVDIIVQQSQIPSGTPPAWPIDLLLIGIVAVAMITSIAVPVRSTAATAILMAKVVVGSIVFGFLLPPDQVLGTGNWAIGASGWCIVALGLRHRLALSVIGLSVWWGATCAVALLHADAGNVVRILGLHSSSVFLLQLLAAWFGASLDRVIQRAAQTNRAYAEALAATAVARILKEQCRTQYRELFESFAPLLRALADGSRSPHDPQVRAEARNEYAQLRRLLDQADSYDHPVVADLLPAIRSAERRGTTVAVEVTAAPRAPADEVHAHILATARMLLQRSASKVRIVLTDDSDETTISILVSGVEAGAAAGVDEHSDLVRTDIDITDNLIWVRLHYSSAQEGERSWSVSPSSMTIR